jgi:hypothetical protein
MKIEQLNNLFSVILKGVIIICIFIVTITYWMKKDNVKYEFHSLDNEPVLFNPRTGEFIEMTFDDVSIINPLTKKIEVKHWEKIPLVSPENK